MAQDDLPGRSQFSALNHFVPQATLRRFASREGHVCEYLTLVSHDTVPEWRDVAISRTAARDHLYTNSDLEGVPTDEIEHWFTDKFETPAQEVITKIEAGRSLCRDEWRKLARYFALQHLRTPVHYVITKQRFASLHEEVLRDMADGIRERIQHHTISNGRHVIYAPDDFPMRVMLDCNGVTGKCSAHAQIISGRKMWLWGMRQGLRPGGPIDALEDHKWTVLRAPEGHSWFTSGAPQETEIYAR